MRLPPRPRRARRNPPPKPRFPNRDRAWHPPRLRRQESLMAPRLHPRIICSRLCAQPWPRKGESSLPNSAVGFLRPITAAREADRRALGESAQRVSQGLLRPAFLRPLPAQRIRPSPAQSDTCACRAPSPSDRHRHAGTWKTSRPKTKQERCRVAPSRMGGQKSP